MPVLPSPTQSTLTQASFFTQSTASPPPTFRHPNRRKRRSRSPTESISSIRSRTKSSSSNTVSWITKLTRFITGHRLNSDNEYDSDSNSTMTRSSNLSKRSDHSLSSSLRNYAISEADSNVSSSSANNNNNKIRLRLVGNRSCTSVLRAEGIPKYLSADNGKYKWYRISSNGDMQRIEGLNDSIFHCHLDDIGHKITCQWIPYGAGYLNNTKKKLKISNFAQIGPILMCSKLEKQCNELLQSNQFIQFRVSIPQCSSFPHIITIKEKRINVAPDTNGIHAMSANIDQFDQSKHQSFEIALNEDTKIVFSDTYSSQFSIVDNDGNEFAQMIAKDHIQRQLIALVIRKNMAQCDQNWNKSPKNNKYYWQFKVQQLTEKNISLQREMNEIRHMNESIMPIIESLSKNNSNIGSDECDYEIVSATERERELYQQCRENKEKLRIQTKQISNLTSERELLKQNFRTKSRHMKQAQRKMNIAKETNVKIKAMLKELQEKDIILVDKAEKYQIENEKLSEQNVILQAKLETVTRQKNEAFGILKSDFSANGNYKFDKERWSRLNSNELVEKIMDLHGELVNERGMRQHQMENSERNMAQFEQLKIECAQLRNRMVDKSELSNLSNTLTWEQSSANTSSNGINKHKPQRNERGQIVHHPQIQLVTNSLNQAQIQQKSHSKTKPFKHISSMQPNGSYHYHRQPLVKHGNATLSRPTFTKRTATNSFQHSESRSIGHLSSVNKSMNGPKITDTFKQLMAPDTNTFEKVAVDRQTLSVDDIYQWAKSHRLVHLRNIAHTLREYCMDGTKLKQLNSTDGVIKLNVLGVPSRHVSETLRAINELFLN